MSCFNAGLTVSVCFLFQNLLILSVDLQSSYHSTLPCWARTSWRSEQNCRKLWFLLQVSLRKIGKWQESSNGICHFSDIWSSTERAFGKSEGKHVQRGQVKPRKVFFACSSQFDQFKWTRNSKNKSHQVAFFQWPLYKLFQKYQISALEQHF